MCFLNIGIEKCHTIRRQSMSWSGSSTRGSDGSTLSNSYDGDSADGGSGSATIPEPDADRVPKWWEYELVDVAPPDDTEIQAQLEARFSLAVVYQQMRST
jgi:hypothetical protein